MKDYIDSYQIPIVTNQIVEKLDGNEQISYLNENIDLNKKKFYKDVLKPIKNYKKKKRRWL